MHYLNLVRNAVLLSNTMISEPVVDSRQLEECLKVIHSSHIVLDLKIPFGNNVESSTFVY